MRHHTAAEMQSRNATHVSGCGGAMSESAAPINEEALATNIMILSAIRKPIVIYNLHDESTTWIQKRDGLGVIRYF